jgi:multiple sugar transport system permease protein
MARADRALAVCLMRSTLRWLAIGLAVAAAICPFVVLFLNGLRPADEFLSSESGLLPTHLTFEHYASVFGANSDTWRYLGNSLVVTTVSTAVAVVLGCLAAYALARLRLPFHLSRVLAIAFLVVRFYPKISIALPYFVLMRRLGLLDTRTAVIIAHVSLTMPFVVWLMLAFFEEFPRELEQSAMLDGCGVMRRFTAIVLPLTAPAIATAAILAALLSWNEFLMASAVGPVMAKTLPVRIASFITDKGILWGDMSAMGTVIVLPVVVFALATQRYLVRGLVAGAVKG